MCGVYYGKIPPCRVRLGVLPALSPSPSSYEPAGEPPAHIYDLSRVSLSRVQKEEQQEEERERQSGSSYDEYDE